MRKRYKLKLSVSRHPGGNRTLTESIDGKQRTDPHPSSDLFAQRDDSKFYRAAAKYIAERAKQYDVTYEDWDD